MEPVVFGLHTAEAKKWITQKEANEVKGFFNVRPDEPFLAQTQFYPDGITKIWIEEIGGQKPRFYIHLKINFSRLLSISNYLIMPFAAANIRKVIAASIIADSIYLMTRTRRAGAVLPQRDGSTCINRTL